jgi:hypothetical protein
MRAFPSRADRYSRNIAIVRLISLALLLSCESISILSIQAGTPGEVKDMRNGFRFWYDKGEATISGFNSVNDKENEHPLADTIGSRG